MGLLDFLKPDNRMDALEHFYADENALLLDVRTEEEYAAGHIPKSVNLPLAVLDKSSLLPDNKDKAIFVYCQGGGRSRTAAAHLRQLGYTNVTDLGGIAHYRGKVEQ